MTRQRFFRVKPANEVLYTTLVFEHSDLGVLRYVTDQYEAKTFYVDGSPEVFEPFGFRAGEPVQGEEGEVSFPIHLGAVGPAFNEKLDAIKNFREPVKIRWAQYLSTDIENAAIYFDLELESATIKDRVVELVAAQVDQSARDVSVIYKTDVFPGLGVAL